MSLLSEIRKQLRVIHGLAKHGESAAEIAIHGRVGPLHDQVYGFEAQVVCISAESLRDILGKSKGAKEESLKEAGEALAAADDRAAQINATNAAAAARANNAAAKQALEAPAPVPAPVVEPAVPAAAAPA